MELLTLISVLLNLINVFKTNSRQTHSFEQAQKPYKTRKSQKLTTLVPCLELYEQFKRLFNIPTIKIAQANEPVSSRLCHRC